MSKPAEKAVETWDLSEMLAVLCQVAQVACGAESVPETNQKMRIALELPAIDREGSRP